MENKLPIIPNVLGMPTGTPTNYNELVQRIGAIERNLGFAQDQLNHYTKALAQLKEQHEALKSEWPDIEKQYETAKDGIKKIISKLPDTIKVSFDMKPTHRYILKNWDYEQSVLHYEAEIKAIEDKMPEYRVNVKLLQKELDSLKELLNT